jgi:hypothetical protein
VVARSRARRPLAPRQVPDVSAAARQLVGLDRRFETLLWLTKDLDAARDQLAWDVEYLRWLASFQRAARSLPAVPRMSVAAVAFLKRLASHGDAAAQRKLDAYEHARIICDEAEASRRVSLEDARALPSALEDGAVMMGVVALQGARRLRMELEPRHYLLLAVWCGLERPIAAARDWHAALRRWTRRAEAIREAEDQLERALRARSGGGGRASARRPPETD